MRMHNLHHASDEEIDGARIAKELRHHGYEVSPGTLHPTLHRLEGQGFFTSRHHVVDGKAIRLYSATSAGEKALAEARERLAELASEALAPRNGVSR